MEPFKNLFSVTSARRIAHALQRGFRGFSEETFLSGLEPALDTLELKGRMHLLADRIETQLPGNPPELFPLLTSALAQNPEDTEGLSSFHVWPLTEIVARRGLHHFEASMAALRAMTICFTAEFAIRPFLRSDLERTLEQLWIWRLDPNEHVRRLVSEGSRPLLPWGERLPAIQKDPELTLPLLEALKNDPSEYVRRSVANHLNDHSKAHPARVVAVLTEWLAADPTNAGLRRLARHASRTLLKSGHSDALLLHGYAPAEVLEVSAVAISPPQLQVGDALSYQLSIRNRGSEPAKVLFDYAIHHRRANGGQSAKVFKGRIRELAPGEIWQVTGTHPLRRVTTRRYHAGLHHFEPRINGRSSPAQPFELVVPES